MNEDLRKWFKEKWVRFWPDGKIRGDCARGDDSEGKPKCLPQSKAHSLGKKGRASAAARKRREDPNPERSGKAINVNTKKKSNEGVAEGFFGIDDKIKGKIQNIVSRLSDEYGMWDHKAQTFTPEGLEHLKSILKFNEKYIKYALSLTSKDFEAEEQLDEKCWDTHKQVGMKNKGGKMVPNCVPKESVHESEKCPHCGGPMFEETLMMEKKDACYYKVKSRYKVWPSAYASGALVQCRKKGAKNWGAKTNENIVETKSAILKGIKTNESK